MRRTALALIGLVVVGCSRTTEVAPYTPAAPSLQATVQYEAGGASLMSGSWGTWCSRQPTHSLELTAQATQTVSGDSTQPAVAFVSFSFRGPRFDNLPADYTQRLGFTGADTIGASAGTANVRYVADSGSARLRRLGGGYARVDFDVWYSPTYVPASPKFRIAGYAELPALPVCDSP